MLYDFTCCYGTIWCSLLRLKIMSWVSFSILNRPLYRHLAWEARKGRASKKDVSVCGWMWIQRMLLFWPAHVTWKQGAASVHMSPPNHALRHIPPPQSGPRWAGRDASGGVVWQRHVDWSLYLLSCHMGWFGGGIPFIYVHITFWIITTIRRHPLLGAPSFYLGLSLSVDLSESDPQISASSQEN